MTPVSGFFDTFKDILEKLEGAGIQYMVVGSIASIIYGEPRMTKDMDVVVSAKPEDAKKFGSLFPIQGFYCPPEDVLIDEIVSRGQFNLIHHESGLKVDIVVCKATPHSILEFSRRKRTSFWKGFEAFVVSPEDLIIKKLEYYREGGSEKHLADIRGVLANTEIDRGYLETWLLNLQLSQQWAKV
ncbi:MAG: hypothetical protein HYR96_14715 [Deltaproteobacteria bacterium]|nr:hypothetical protein [Deltaproteobacteria bacterium]MBI3294830.1 hypothetical protein [Deltaproteobacteria bacterium]